VAGLEVGTGARIHGTAELARAVAGIVDGLDHMAGAYRKTAAAIAQAGAARAPHLTGALAASLTPYSSDHRASVRSGLPYAGPVHWGWPGHNIAPNPFLLEAARAVESAWVGDWSDAIQELIDTQVVTSGAAFI
jgi:phage gpG-like protein